MTEQNLPGLLPCPFCGGEAEFKPYKKDGLTIRCKSLGCVRRDQRVLRQSIDWLRERMVTGWNARAAVEQSRAWLPIETAPKDGTPVDLWCSRDNERLANYRRISLGKGNVFYEAVYAGRCCVRTASHWMPLPSAPAPSAAGGE